MKDEFSRPGAATGAACLKATKPRHFNPQQARRYCKEKYGIDVAEATFAKYRCIGGGPKFFKFGRSVFYSESALDAWIDMKLGDELSSTSEAGQ